MGSPDIKENIPLSKEDISEKKSDKLNFLNDSKFTDIKEPLSKTINDLAKENIVSQEDFWGNIKNITEKLLSDPLFDFDTIAKQKQAENIFIFRQEFKNINKEDIHTEKQDIHTEKEEKITKLRGETEEKYAQINKIYKPTSEQIKAFKNEEKIKKIINNENFKNIPADKQDLYLSYRYAGEQIVKEAKKPENKNTVSQENYDFIKNFNRLDTDLNLGNPIDISDLNIEGLAEQKKSMKSMQNIVEDKDLGEHLVESNKDIEGFVLDTKTNTLDTKEIEDNKDIKKTMGDKLGTRYKDEIQEGITQLLKKNKLDSYTKNFDASGKTINTDKIPEKDKKKLEKISAKVIDIFTEKVQEELLKNTNEVIKTKAVGALVKNIGQYFQVKNYQQEDFAKDFDIDTKNGITFDGKILRLSGSMEGKEIGFDYDMKTGEVTADDFVHYNQEDKTFYISKDGAEGRERLPLKMQTLDEMLARSKTETTKNITKALADIKNNLPKRTEAIIKQRVLGSYSPKEKIVGCLCGFYLTK